MTVLTMAGRKNMRRDAVTLLFWLLPLLFLGVFFFQPLFAIFRLAVQAALAEGFDPATLSRVWRPLGFTLFQAALSTLLTLLVGLPAAYVFARFEFPGKNLLRVLSTLPFILPTVVVAAGFNALLGPRGVLNLALMGIFDLSTAPVEVLNTLGAILLAHVFYNTTVVLRVVGGAWSQLDTRLEGAARVLGASRLRAMLEVTLPLLLPAIVSSALLVFLFDFTSFGVILLLGGPRHATLEVEIYRQALSLLNLPLAGLLSAIQLGFTLIITILYSLISRRTGEVPLMPRLKGEGVRKARTWAEWALIVLVVITLLALLVAPMLSMVYRSVARVEANRGERGGTESGLTTAYYSELFINRRESLFYVPPIGAIRNSLIYAGTTVGISLVLGFLAAYALSGRSVVNRLMDPLLMLPLGTSAVTLGLGFIVVFNRPPLDVRSFPLLVPLAHSLVALPFVVRTLLPAIRSIPERLRESARVLGASPLRVWLHVDLPILARATLVSAVFAFTISLGEFGATSFLTRPEYPTMPVAIFRFLGQPGGLNYGQAMAMSTLLMLVCGLGIFIMERANTADQA